MSKIHVIAEYMKISNFLHQRKWPKIVKKCFFVEKFFSLKYKFLINGWMNSVGNVNGRSLAVNLCNIKRYDRAEVKF